MPPTPSMSGEKESGEESGARWLGWVGAIMLLLGVGFFLKYAFDHWIDPMGQVAMGIIGGLLIIGLGHKLRAKYQRYADLLIGSGVAILYFTIFAGFAFYTPPVLGQEMAFALMIMVTVLAMVLSVAGGTINLAGMATLGGFLTPVMLSTGENHLVTLSLYMIVLNIGVLGVSWYQKWTKLNYLAFLGTIFLFGGWMGEHYTEHQLGITLFFATMFFGIFLVNSVLHHFVRKESSTRWDLVLLCLNAFGYFAVVHNLLQPRNGDYLGFFALLMAIIYLSIAYAAYTREMRDRTLNLTLPGIAVVFLSIAIPLQFSGYWITIAWLVEAVVLVYVGLSVRERTVQIFGWIVLVLGTISMFGEVEEIRSGGSAWRNFVGNAPVVPDLTPVLNMAFLLLAFGTLAYFAASYLYARYRHPDAWQTYAGVFLVLANLLAIYTLTTEVNHTFDQKIRAINVAASEEYERSGQPDIYGNYFPAYSADVYEKTRVLANTRNTAVSVLWALYATLLLVIGFVRRVRVLRIFGLIFFFITAFKVLAEVWALGQLYRIISTIAFGVIALGAAFLYAKYKQRLKEIIYD